MPDAKTTDPRIPALETLRGRFCDEPVVHWNTPGSTSSDAAGFAASLGPDGIWPDIDYSDSSLINWTTARHLVRLRTMAITWYRHDSKLHRDASLLRAVLLGLDGWYLRNPQNPNWWWNQIGAPQTLGEILLLIKGSCAKSYIERACPAFLCHQPITRFTGQNLVWTAVVEVMHGILTDDPDRVSHGFIMIGKELRVFPDAEGLQPDMSFHQHGKLLYSGGYGQNFAADIGRIMALSAGTVYAFPEHMVSLVSRFILDGSRWMVRGRTFNPAACGRELSRQGHGAERFHEGLRHLASFAHPRQAEARESLAVSATPGRSMVSGNRHFWCSDLMVHHRPGFCFSVRVPSPRVWNNDWPCGGEGTALHHMADGATFLMRDGDEYRDIYPVWNWRQIPGTTAPQHEGELNPDALRLRGERGFAGGASDGSVGCAAVDFVRAGLSARKAWFFFNDSFVALGADIKCAYEVPLRTTLNQCLLRGQVFISAQKGALREGEYRLGPGSIFRHDGFEYHVIDGAGTLRLGPQTGSWSACGVGSKELLTLQVLNAGLDHGIKPAAATYAYAVLHRENSPDCLRAEANRFMILRNDADAQAVWDPLSIRGQAVFYRPAEITFPDGLAIKPDHPCILLYNPEENGRMAFTLAQPEQLGGMLTLRLSGRKDGSFGIQLPAHEYAGSSVSFSCVF